MTKETVDKTAHFNAEDVRTFFRFLGHNRKEEWTELRAIIKVEEVSHVNHLWTQDEDEFVDFVREWNGKRQVYAGVNPRKGHGLKGDEHIARITVIPFDVDSDHPKNQAATDEEIEKAREKLDLFLKLIEDRGLERPFVSNSGNGFHVFQRVSIEFEDWEHMKEKLEVWHHELTDEFGLDSMFNLERIMKVSGVMSIKGTPTAERPHRLTHIIDKGSETVDKRTIELISSIVVESPAESTDSKTSVDSKEDYTNRLKTLRESSPKLDLLLRVECPSGYPSPSEADMATLSVLKLSGFNASDAVSVLREYRYRDKLDRDDYISGMTDKIWSEKKDEYDISDFVKQTSNGEASPVLIPGEHSFAEMTLDELDITLTTTIVYDRENKIAVFLSFILNYTEDDQQNIGMSSPSSSGKSYICLQVAMYFPEEDVMDLGYVSQQAFYHEMGDLTLTDGTPILSRENYVSKMLVRWHEENPRPEIGEGVKDWRGKEKDERRRLKNNWDELDKVHTIDLHQKIILFMDQPNYDLVEHIRPLMSHDKKEIISKITDKSSGGQHRTKTIRMVGYPTVAYLSTQFTLAPEEQTRLLLLSADVDSEKIESSIKMLGDRLKDRDSFVAELDKDPGRKLLRERVRAIKEEKIRQILLREEDMDYLVNTFLKKHKSNLIPRHQRDFPRFVALAKAHALLNLWTRERVDDTIYATREDIDAVIDIYDYFAASNELGIPPIIYDFWITKVEPALEDSLIVLEDKEGNEISREYDGLSRRDLSKLYRDRFRDSIGGKRLKSFIDVLVEAGLVIEETDPEDKRRMKLYPPGVGIGKDPPLTNHSEEPFTDSLGAIVSDDEEGGISVSPPSGDIVFDEPEKKPPLTEEVLILFLEEKEHTHNSLRDHVVENGYPIEEFKVVFEKLKKDSRLRRRGKTPVYYSWKEEVSSE